MTPVLNVHSSILGQPWRWRGLAADARDPGFAPDDLVTQLLLTRGCAREELEAHRSPSIRAFMPDPSIFRDMDRAAERLADSVERREAVTIFGDYDVDGATSAALLIRLLRDLGLDPRAYIPDRLMEGYGPSGEALVRLKREGADLIVTVDCGAMAFDALAEARDAGAEVIVVDHHKCASVLPVALALVNPNRLDEDEGRQHGHLAAVGVAWLLGAALVRVLRGRGFFANRAEPKLLDLLDIVALGTVADVAALKGLNRAFVAQGLKVMAQRRNTGMNALIEASRLTRAPTATDLGFALGPRINAGGRVGKSDLGVRLLTTEDADEARGIAEELNRLNEERRAIEAEVQQSAEAIEAEGAVAVVAARGWHPGVIGIVAGRLKERLGRPAIVIAIGEDGIGKGSGRSIAGVDLGAAILAAKEAGLLIAGGGHAMAAGVTIAEDQIPALVAFLDEKLAETVERAAGERALLLDAVLAPGGVNPALVNAMEAGGPYGMGWPAPRVAAGPVRIIKCDVVGNGHVRAIVAGEDGRSIKCVAFRSADTPLGLALLGAPRDRRLWIAGRAKIDDWGARPAAEIHIEDAAWVE
ncbi:single-stranded-DNA-specific exonuclease RecJ [Sphingomonas koreensis]|jgi:single-stranded-DNA-specific exonuclease|uniref:Single-stranded-DNA-specific exonuclease RecJ n=1 Tax=Sphingomonas koreensis TaxID=93064 RepID=A0A1L6JF78_9SPHN|nr:single-stranded-DNA-specific exonuclease RecJ [Sphingomonas koreensis]APR54573.1 single-stranded-DNA-specific exonuclease RecJ [Sphingomonas koreensis]MDC7810864.1 single-stranded-DNA-specific exonuclease RecJ [Sphingomonas koreensis]RSU20459.1 single-stranded-DNA-specific exonuclease RecJ [Sphingomonas koreensis]RSU28845.1 single-stranded-DNA-specific exonuclease RecJ [Sphingomonas koreensis]RSU29641.1 single-stranded-DNA-specific exonuclease RecJ [Sphingomonas koreensis]